MTTTKQEECRPEDQPPELDTRLTDGRRETVEQELGRKVVGHAALWKMRRPDELLPIEPLRQSLAARLGRDASAFAKERDRRSCVDLVRPLEG